MAQAQPIETRRPTYHGLVPSSLANPCGDFRLPPTGPSTKGIPSPATGDGYRIASGTG